ncbi:AEC family transporter [Haloarcula pelagica]|uniref:AEC family transporter n=1 Tax=Haloarcula pelagica TaxID=3033389 RepID=UPI0024C25884|nr:AEC family transporter [Halomicroarcula sp. YJ-61-S]
MEGAVGRFAYLLGMLAVGLGARYTGLLDEHRRDRLNAVAFYVVLPSLIFVSTYDRALATLLSPELVVGVLIVVFATVGMAWVIHRRQSRADRRGVAVVQSYHSNLGYLGLPLVAATFGPDATATAGLLLGLVTLTQIPVTVWVLVTVADAEVSVLDQVRELLTNPVLIALALGVVVAWFGLGVPAAVVTPLSLAGELALPVALILVGSALDLDQSVVDPTATASVVALKLGWMPLVAWLTFSTLGVDPAVFTASVLMLGMPTAVSTFVYATELGGDAEFASVNVFATTLASVGTSFVLILMLG